MDANNISRSVYTFFDALGSAGGIQGILASLAVFLNSITTYNKSENYLAGRLYQMKSLKRSPVKQWL